MTLDVSNKISSIHTVIRNSSDSEHKSTVAQTSTTMKKASDQSVSYSSLMLDEAFQTLSDEPDVDLEKVRAVQVALESGSLQLDEDVLVQAILEMHK